MSYRMQSISSANKITVQFCRSVVPTAFATFNSTMPKKGCMQDQSPVLSCVFSNSNNKPHLGRDQCIHQCLPITPKSQNMTWRKRKRIIVTILDELLCNQLCIMKTVKRVNGRLQTAFCLHNCFKAAAASLSSQRHSTYNGIYVIHLTVKSIKQ